MFIQESRKTLLLAFPLIAGQVGQMLMGVVDTMMVARIPVPLGSVSDTVMIGHVGDSRAYLFCDGALSQITKDHSYVQLLIDNGNISPAAALFHPQRNIITKAIGTQPEIEADIYTLAFKKSDCILLCSDGLNASVSDESIAKILARGIFSAADNLVEAALGGGGIDDISVIIACEGGGGK